MREIICISVVLLGLAGRDQVKSYIPTVAVATAATDGVLVPKGWMPKRLADFDLADTADAPTCKSGKCGVRRTQAVIKAGTAKMRTRQTTRRRLFRRTLKIRRR